MAIKDYSTEPDMNTTISGINIAEGCAPSGINNAIRQLMADVKAEKDKRDFGVQSELLRQLVSLRRNCPSKWHDAMAPLPLMYFGP